jgi:glucose-6-phosphate-specific signal transduction histidine kinase
VNARVEADDTTLRLSIRDDGIGGADTDRGSGLLGLIDRVEALGGRMQIASPAGDGTSLLATIPLGRSTDRLTEQPRCPGGDGDGAARVAMMWQTAKRTE